MGVVSERDRLFWRVVNVSVFETTGKVAKRLGRESVTGVLLP
ncbi:MAG: hypothetical protein SWE60_06720 [Thermodesulfobacteriota bacterium]|nr:hypothetical protein [Thermodesulfobacteriota bacterium]